MTCLQTQRLPAGMEACAKKHTIGDESGEKMVGQESSPCFENTTCMRISRKEEMKRQRRMKIMKDITKKIRSRERMDAENRWWVAELLAADCEKTWLHPGEEETMQKWYVLLEN